MTRFGGRPFVLLWCVTLLFYLSFQLQLPIVPIYAASLGGREADVGFIVGVFAFAAMLLRPVAGELTDRIGRRPLILAGTAIFTAASLGYPVTGGIAALLALRLFHGVGMGLGPTAATVMVTDLAPPERRGAAMGVFSLTTSVGLAMGPYLGIELQRRAGFAATFLVSAGIAASALLLAWTLPETRPARAAGRGGTPPSSPGPAHDAAGLTARLFSREALYPSLLLLSLFFSYGGLVSFLPLFAERERLGNPGLFFTALALAGVVVRHRAGHLADRVGRRTVVAPALALAGVALVVLGLATSPPWLLVAAVLYGIAFGAAQPALMAMTADRVPAEARGRAMGTLYTAWELGISAGSVLLGVCAARLGYQVMWWIAAGTVGVGALAATRHITRARG